MNETRKQIARDARSPIHPNLPTATARAVTFFVPAGDDRRDTPVSIKLIDYGIISVVQVTAVASTAITVTDLAVNDEFHPVIAIGNPKELFVSLDWPLPVTFGKSFQAIVQAPNAAEKVQGWCCYPKSPKTITVSTSEGDFDFAIGQTIVQGE